MSELLGGLLHVLLRGCGKAGVQMQMQALYAVQVGRATGAWVRSTGKRDSRYIIGEWRRRIGRWDGEGWGLLVVWRVRLRATVFWILHGIVLGCWIVMPPSAEVRQGSPTSSLSR